MIELNSNELTVLGAIAPSQKELKNIIIKDYIKDSDFWTRTINEDGIIVYDSFITGFNITDWYVDDPRNVYPVIVIDNELKINKNEILYINSEKYILLTPHLLLKLDSIGYCDWQDDYDRYLENRAEYKDSNIAKIIDTWFKKNFETD